MRKKKIYLSAALTLFTLGLLLFSGNQPVKAAQVDYETTWDIHVDFVGNNINAVLTVEVWEFTAGSLTKYLVTTRNLPCLAPDSVTIADNEATFSGAGGIHCFVPSRRQIAYVMTGGEFIPPAQCLSKEGALAESDMVLDPNNSGQLRINPIFTMPDLALQAEMPPFPTLTTTMRFVVDTQNAVSGQFTASPGLNALQAQFDQVNDPHGGDLAYQPLFLANGTQLFAFPANIDEDLALSLQRSRLDIGYSPETGAGLYGRIRSLDVDPGCFGTG